MLKIGEFSGLARISVKALRYYDDLGLLRPAHVDTETGYRYYSVSQLPRLHRILALRDLGFPLERIAQLLDEGLTADALHEMLAQRQEEQEKQVQEEVERLDRLKALRHLIAQEGQMTGDVILKDVGPQWVVSLRENIPQYRMAGTLFGKFYGLAWRYNDGGPGIALLHDTEYREHGVDVEAGFAVRDAISVDEPLRCHQLQAASVASYVHHGAFNRIGEAYATLLRWVEANGYHPCGPTREVFLHVSTPVTRDDESNVTEIQVPVTRNS